MKKQILLSLFGLLSFSAFASHYRAGEITYTWLTGNTYKFHIVTYTNTCNTQTDDCTVDVYFGNGDQATAPRVNGPVSVNCPPGVKSGVNFSSCFRINIYETTYTYNGDGDYTIYVEQNNRKAGIVNVPNSLTTPFHIQTHLKINSLLGHNSSPTLLYPPVDSACLNHCFTHNPMAYDPDGDSLSYTLYHCLGLNGQGIPGYTIPSGVSVDAHTGDLTWCSPQQAPPPYTNIFPQEYNLAMVIHEWRFQKELHTWYEIGNVERDLEVDVLNCNDFVPQVDANDTCVLAGSIVSITVTASDADNNLISLSASGAPMDPVFVNPVATFTPTSPQSSPATGTFTWNTTCDLVRKFPYQVQFKAKDNAQPVSLSGFKSIFITIVAPAPQNLTATPYCDQMNLSWSPPTCDPSPDSIIGYKIYRLNNCDNWNHSACETGVPASTGYSLTGTVTGVNTTTFIDHGLTHGVIYAYHVVAFMKDGAESYASNRVCRSLALDAPIITNVDVVSTGNNDTIRVKWLKPLAGINNLDTILHPGPYVYKIYRDTGFVNSSTLVSTLTYPNFQNFNVDSFIDINLTTDIHSYNYHIQMFAQNGTDQLCKTDNASSVYLSLVPNDNRLTLNWNSNVPWMNYKYYIYRKIPSPFVPYTLIDSTTVPTYTDLNLVNGREYCYKIKAYGKYADPALPAPLINWSEEKCGKPLDRTAPCSPVLSINSSCDLSFNDLAWTNPNTTCTDGTDDVVSYNLFYTPTLNGDFQLIATIPSPSILSFVHDSLSSVAGCYVIAAVDSFGNQSAFSSKMCVDNCPNYDLPNVFTPNGDGINDLFVPFPYKYVKDIELKIFNRWGGLVFETNDPKVMWNGQNINNQELCSDGVYYFTCKVNEIKLAGIEPRMIKGFVQILGGK